MRPLWALLSSLSLIASPLIPWSLIIIIPFLLVLCLHYTDAGERPAAIAMDGVDKAAALDALAETMGALIVTWAALASETVAGKEIASTETVVALASATRAVEALGQAAGFPAAATLAIWDPDAILVMAADKAPPVSWAATEKAMAYAPSGFTAGGFATLAAEALANTQAALANSQTALTNKKTELATAWAATAYYFTSLASGALLLVPVAATAAEAMASMGTLPPVIIMENAHKAAAVWVGAEYAAEEVNDRRTAAITIEGQDYWDSVKAAVHEASTAWTEASLAPARWGAAGASFTRSSDVLVSAETHLAKSTTLLVKDIAPASTVLAEFEAAAYIAAYIDAHKFLYKASFKTSATFAAATFAAAMEAATLHHVARLADNRAAATWASANRAVDALEAEEDAATAWADATQAVTAWADATATASAEATRPVEALFTKAAANKAAALPHFDKAAAAELALAEYKRKYGDFA